MLAEIAYRPALLYIDSVKYLAGSDDSEPQGYRLLLRLLDPLGGLGLVTAVQHVFGLVMAAAVYVLLVRRRAPRWLAALAVAPVLLDAYQLQLEQTIMPDVLFETMITAGLVLLVPVLIYAIMSVPRRPTGRRRVASAVLAGVCFLLPVCGYVVGTSGMTGHARLATNGPGPGYGRAAASAAVILLLSSDAFEFSWRYQLPAVVLLPLAGALGVSACLTAARTASGGTGRRTRPAGPPASLRAPAGR